MLARTGRRVLMSLLVSAVLLLSARIRLVAHAADMEYGSLSDYDFSNLQQEIDRIFKEEELDFGALVREILRGETKLPIKRILSFAGHALTAEIAEGRRAMLLVLGIGIMAAVFHNISLAFDNRQIADTGYFITYLAFLSVTVLSFSGACQIAEKLLLQLEDFMKALIPAFFLAVSASSGSVSAVGFYKVLLVLLSLADSLLLKLLLPVIKLSTVILLVNYITKEEMLSRLAKLFETIVSWGLKGMLTLVIGMNTMQGLILPSIDRMKLSVLQKAVSILPGIGNSAEAVAGLMAQSGEMIKNGIGTAAFFLLGAMLVIPVVKLGVLILLYQITCAMLQPLSDRRMVEALSAVGSGSRYLLQLSVTAGVLYLVTVAVVCAAT